MTAQRGMVIHIAEGYYEGTISWQKTASGNDAVSSHFVIGGPSDAAGVDGRIGQVVDTEVTAWTQRAGNGSWISAEFSGFTPHALSPAQVESAARLYAKGMKVYGWRPQLANKPTDFGLGHHSMGTAGHDNPTDTWTGATWGHEDCPGPAIYAQKPAILARAIQIFNGTTTGGSTVPRIFNWGGKVWVSDGATRRWIPNDAAAKKLFTAFPGTNYITVDEVYATWSSADLDAVFGPDVATLGGGGSGPVAIGTKFSAQVTG
jgi:hypothetical protein